MANKYADIPARYINEVRSILVKEGFKNMVADGELASVHRIFINQLPAEDAAYAIIGQREHYDNDED